MYVVRKALLFNSQQYTPGDVFPWQEVGCDERRLRQLYEARYLDSSSEVERIVAKDDSRKKRKN